MPDEGKEWLPVILRCLSRSPDSDLNLEEAYSIRADMQKRGLNPGAIALLILQFEDADPSTGSAQEIDGYC
jgi:uncharacterized protein YciU (UPF0263 family)